MSVDFDEIVTRFACEADRLLNGRAISESECAADRASAIAHAAFNKYAPSGVPAATGTAHMHNVHRVWLRREKDINGLLVGAVPVRGTGQRLQISSIRSKRNGLKSGAEYTQHDSHTRGDRIFKMLHWENQWIYPESRARWVI